MGTEYLPASILASYLQGVTRLYPPRHAVYLDVLVCMYTLSLLIEPSESVPEHCRQSRIPLHVYNYRPKAR